MAPQFPSIQSFFQAKSSPSSKRHQPPSSFPSTTAPVGDGFSSEEVDAVLHPTLDTSWIPTQNYEELEIGDLDAGPRCVTFIGRIVNLYDQATPSKAPKAAKGCIKLIVADGSGALTVRLWYANMTYMLRLGQLISVWTPHISSGENGTLAPSSAPLFTSVFPERDRNCHLMVHEHSDEGVLCKTPIGYRRGQPLPGLMTLQNFVNGGYDVADGRILVCVKSIGARKKFVNKKNVPSELINIGVFDDTGEASLTLWGSTSASAAPWQPSHTVLLITNPGWRIDRKASLSVTANTHVDVDPSITDAIWLRSFAQRLTKRDHVNPPFPEGVFDIEAAESSQLRVLYRLADIDDFARAAPKEKFMGYLSVVILDLHIVSNFRRNMLMCTECCGVPLYANAVTAKCKQCEKYRPLGINPRLLGTLLDETGSLASGKLNLSQEAWDQLFGRSAFQLVSSSLEVLKYLEQRLLFLRVTLCFGWALEGEGVVERDEVEVGDLAKEKGKGRKRKRAEADVGKRGGEGYVRGGAGKSGDGVGEVGRLCVWGVRE